MSKAYKTEQEAFWAGEFGDQYVERNQGQAIVSANLALFSRIIERTRNVRSAIEFGANIGLNLAALRLLVPGVELSAIEINDKAVEVLRQQEDVKVYAQSILEFEPDAARDLALIKGVLIHIDPASLPAVYDRLYASTNRYLCVAEYYNPSPVEVPYRGNKDRLFKRDFAGELLDRFPDLALVDYGFCYRRDPNYQQDDITWFLLEKRA
jgi:spore coat polysaccharide biosynthesis protein SpsF